MQFQKTTIKIPDQTAQKESFSIDYVEPFIVEVLKPKEPAPLPSQDLTGDFVTAPNDRPIIETVLKSPEDSKISDTPVAKPSDILVAKLIEDPIPIDFVMVEKVPIYLGCEKYNTNEERKQCMSDQISKLVSKKFNTDVGALYGISGKQRIDTEFTIDKNGNVTNIKLRGPHQALEKEAERVIKSIPRMQPGLQRNVPVGVIYTLPIIFDAGFQ